MELAATCKRLGVPVMLDGAHVLGQLPVNLKSLEAAGVQYWVSDAHKWLFAPKGSAVLWVTRDSQDSVKPAALGAAVCSGASTANFDPAALAGLSDFEIRFQYTGTRDYTPMAAVAAALDFRESIGESAIIGYNHGMAVWAQRYLAELWGTECLLPDSSTCAMAHVRLPGVRSRRAADALSRLLRLKHGIHVMLFGLPDPRGGTAYWARPCFQVYVQHDDVVALGAAVLEEAPLASAAAAAWAWRRAALGGDGGPLLPVPAAAASEPLGISAARAADPGAGAGHAGSPDSVLLSHMSGSPRFHSP